MVIRGLLILGVLLAGALSTGAEGGPGPAEVRKAITRSLPYLEQDGVSWMASKGCVSCHRVAFMIWAHDEARRQGFPVEAAKIDQWTTWSLEKMTARGKEGGGLDTMSQMLLARDPSLPWPSKPSTERKGLDHFQTLAENIVERQKPDGSWPPEGQLTTPPEVTTYWALLALEPRTDEAPTGSRSRALAYLKTLEPATSTEALVLRFLGARRFGETARAETLRQEILTRQNPDGGWSYQKGPKPSDAFATGQVLYALGEEWRKQDARAVRQGWKYLTQSQAPNGSWLVSTGSIHNKAATPARVKKTDETYTYWGSAWAAIGLLRTLGAGAPSS